MQTEIKNYIKLELRNHASNKKLLSQILPYDVITQRHFLWLYLLVQSVELALEEVPPEVVEYVKVRYFDGNDANVSCLAHELNIGERTLKRYDSIFVEAIARNMGIFRR